MPCDACSSRHTCPYSVTSRQHMPSSVLQLLATAEEETARHAEEAALLHRAHEAQAVQATAAEERAAELLRQRLELQHRVEELEAAGAEQAGVVAAQGAELVQLRSDLARARAEGLALAEEKARLEVRQAEGVGTSRAW